MNEPRNITFMRCAFYGRYSTNMQRLASLEDQRRVCSEFATEKGWEILEEHIYVDAAQSGTSKVGRMGLKALEAATEQHPRPFDYILFDDTSRLARDLGDVLQFHKMMQHHGIKLLFVSQRLDSADQSFPMLLSMHGMIDEQQIARIKHKVHSAQKGRVLAGYIAGSWPYGYRAVVEDNVEFPGAIGRAATKGTKLEVVEDQAIVVRRIFELFSEGHSLWRIAVRLNQEGIPRDSQFRSRGNGKGWPNDAIKTILHNEKYKGVYVWNRKRQQVHPKTGKITTEIKSAHEHIRVEAPHLRIVSDDLWNRAATRLNELKLKQEARRLGGYNRTKDIPYLYSGLLVCGICGSRLRADGPVKLTAYTCPSYRLRRGCTNSYRIRQDRAAAQVTDQITNQLTETAFFDHLVKTVHAEVKHEWTTRKASAATENPTQLEADRRACQRRIDALLDSIEDVPAGDPTAGTLSARLRQRQFELEQLESKIALTRSKRAFPMTEEDLRELVRENVHNLLSVLKSDVAYAKEILQRHIRHIVLFPATDERGQRYFEVVGEMNLFKEPSGQESRVMLGALGTQNSQQHTFNSSYGFVFRLYQDADPCRLLEYFVKLLEADPSLSLRSLSATEWSNLLREVIPDSPQKHARLGYGAVARCFWRHQDQLSNRLLINKLPNRRDPGHRYQLSLRA
jgi:site-specific DNA recombinase